MYLFLFVLFFYIIYICYPLLEIDICTQIIKLLELPTTINSNRNPSKLVLKNVEKQNNWDSIPCLRNNRNIWTILYRFRTLESVLTKFYIRFKSCRSLAVRRVLIQREDVFVLYLDIITIETRFKGNLRAIINFEYRIANVYEVKKQDEQKQKHLCSQNVRHKSFTNKFRTFQSNQY